MSLMLAMSMFAQKDVTKFLGIPVDGTKAEMIRKLKAKGFTSTAYDKDILEGEFNGQDVYIHVVTNNNKVYRIVVVDAYGVDETDIRIRYNNLCEQFSNNINYMSGGDYSIPMGEDISYEMIVNNKRYDAIFFQKAFNDSAITTDEFLELSSKKVVWFSIREDIMVGKYLIMIYYENLYNKANGQDL